MWPLVMLIVSLSVIGSVSVLSQTSRDVPMPSVAGTPAALADNFFVYANAVGEFVSAQPPGYTAPGPANAVPDASLSFPAWHLRNPRWSNAVIDGTVTIFAQDLPASIDMSFELASRTGGAFRAGIVDASSREIVSLLHGPSGATVPAWIPDGAPVFQFTTR